MVTICNGRCEMANNILYFNDNFFSAGRTEIYNERKEIVGKLDLRSALSSGIDVLGPDGGIIISAKFPVLSNKWIVYNSGETELGVLKYKFSFFTKKYEYDANGRGVYTIHSEAFSSLYEIYETECVIANFEKVSGFFSSPAFQLKNESDILSNEELIAVVMGVNAIQKRHSNAGN
jgi:hypothetical protein